MFTVFYAVSLGLASMTGTLNPALAPTRSDLEHVWQVGYERAGHDKDMKGALKFAQRGIGSINNKTVSWLTFEHPRLAAFEGGFNARKQHWTDQEAQASRDRLTDLADGHLHRLTLHGQIGLYPAIRVQRISREADPDDLRAVRVVFQVGERTYQPVAQPGDVEAQAQGGHFRRDKTVTTTTRKKDRDGKRHTEDTEIHIPIEEHYTWYKGEFDVAFDLYDSDGTPRITDRDKEFTIVVILRAGERRATFRLDDWLTAYER